MTQTVAYIYHDPILESVTEPIDWEIDVQNLYVDLGDRQALGQLMQLVNQGAIHTLLIRQIRDLGDSIDSILHVLNQLEHAKVALRVMQGDLPKGTDPNWIQQLQWLQELNQDQHRQAIQKGHARNRLAALPPPGRAPFGYRRGKDRYVIDRAAASIVKDFFENFLLYGSLRGAVRFINQKHQKKISISTGRNWLTNPAYRGDLAYKNGDVILNTHPPLVSREEAAQVDRLLRRNQTLAPKTASAARSLAGLVNCAQCQAKLAITSTRSRGSKTPNYLYLRPNPCGKGPSAPDRCPLADYNQVLKKTIQRICRELPQRVSQAQLPNIEQLKSQIQQQLQAQEARLTQLIQLKENGILDENTLQIRSYQIRVEMGTLQDRLSQLPPASLSMISRSVSIPEFWQDLSEAERRFYFREFLKGIWLTYSAKGKGEPTWRVQSLDFVF